MDKHTTIFKISLRLFNKTPDQLTKEEKEEVINIYYDYY